MSEQRQGGEMPRHKEAFCLMKYATDDGSEVEWLWNSRDGVTPFVLRTRSGDREMTHVDWHLDTPLPAEFVPPKGMRIFIDLTPELAREWAEHRVAQAWDHAPHYREQFASKEKAVEELARSYLSNPGAPAVMEAGSGHE